MRIRYVAIAAAAATLAASTHGRQAIPSAAESSPLLQTISETRHQSFVNGKTDRFLTSTDKDEAPLMVAPTGYASSVLQGGGNRRHLRGNNADGHDSDSSSESSEHGKEEKPGVFTRLYRRFWAWSTEGKTR
ncbi:unnamed protein product [Hyaloperonospora brassicae]|uniref:RxLR effector candidate protein n=1 Tax=Hyaloperonospora brassicae TaxID=162125 RepID=A0AAV0TJZ5_HYABA|nr:unnamed protein product [Hyaloperonospora brassicae]